MRFTGAPELLAFCEILYEVHDHVPRGARELGELARQRFAGKQFDLKALGPVSSEEWGETPDEVR